MPFKSEKQRRFLHANHPEVAKDWEEKYENAEADISSDEEHPRDSMYLKDDPEALKKALAYHRRNVAKLSRKSFADLTDEEYDSLKHSEGELELNEGEENNERYDDRDPVDDDALERARREDKLMGDIKVDHGGKPKNIRKGMKDLDDKIKRMQSFKEFYNGK
jgi:hypothetical protein